jgi:hypothetical protein
MRAGKRVVWWAAALIASQLMLLAVAAGSAFGDAQVRFVHAVPGEGTSRLDASEGGITEKIADGIGFGQIGSYASVPAGRVIFEARRSGGGKLIAAAEEQLRNGAHYTVVAIGNGEATLALIRDASARAGEARLRTVHAASELGEVDVRLGNRRIASLFGFEDVAPYADVDPGAYELRITRPSDGSELATAGGVSLSAGSASTAFIVGTSGERLQIITDTDRTAAPVGAPATGLGGLADEDSHLLLALLAGLLAAALGAAGYAAVTGRSRGHGS